MQIFYDYIIIANTWFVQQKRREKYEKTEEISD